MKKLLLIMMISVSFTQISHAGLLLEPYLGYQINGSDTDNVDVKAGIVKGARIGYSMLGFFAAVDYGLTSFDYESNGTVIYSADQTKMALAVGYDVPVLPIRVFARYFMSSKINMTGAGVDTMSAALVAVGGSNYAFTEIDYKGKGIGFGVGFTLLPFVDINLEYNMITYDETETDNDLVKLSDFGESKNTEILLTASLPFTL